jgi:hypothetical protein
MTCLSAPTSCNMYGLGHSLQRRPGGKSGHVRCSAESRSSFVARYNGLMLSSWA